MNKVLGIAILSSTLILNSIFVLAEDTATQSSTSTTTTSTTTTPDTTATTPTTTDATETVTTPTTTTTEPATATPTPKDAEVAANLSSAYNSSTVTAQDVANARAAGFGYGEIGNLYGLAAISGTPVADIASMRQSLGWGEIAQSLGLKLSDIKSVDKPAKEKTTAPKAATAAKASKTSNKQAGAKSASSTSGSSSKGNSGGSSSGGGHGSGGGGGHGGGSGGGHGGGGGGGGHK